MVGPSREYGLFRGAAKDRQPSSGGRSYASGVYRPGSRRMIERLQPVKAPRKNHYLALIYEPVVALFGERR